MPPRRFAACALGLGGFDRGKPRRNAERRGHGSNRAALEKMSSCNRQCGMPVADADIRAVEVRDLGRERRAGAELVRTQYKASIRRITLLFPHDSSLGAAPLRRIAPVTTPLATLRSLIAK